MEIKNNLIQFNKLEIENIMLKFEIAFLKSKNRRLKLKIKKLKFGIYDNINTQINEIEIERNIL
jgi:chaperonin cofactor prefoldin